MEAREQAVNGTVFRETLGEDQIKSKNVKKREEEAVWRFWGLLSPDCLASHTHARSNRGGRPFWSEGRRTALPNTRWEAPHSICLELRRERAKEELGARFRAWRI